MTEITQTYQEAVTKMVQWWTEKSFGGRINQNNGDDSEVGSLVFMLMNSNSLRAQGEVTPAKIEKFKEKLTELLLKGEGGRLWERRLDVDYHPCPMLVEARDYADINPSCLPCKTTSYIDDNSQVKCSYQYGGAWQTL